jgi:hypothetical protein
MFFCAPEAHSRRGFLPRTGFLVRQASLTVQALFTRFEKCLKDRRRVLVNDEGRRRRAGTARLARELAAVEDALELASGPVGNFLTDEIKPPAPGESIYDPERLRARCASTCSRVALNPTAGLQQAVARTE